MSNYYIKKITNGIDFDTLKHIDISSRYSSNFEIAQIISQYCKYPISAYDCELYKSLIAIKTEQYSFSIIIDIISFVKLRKLLKLVCISYYNKIYKIGNMQINEKGKNPIHLTINYRIDCPSSFLCQIFSSNFYFSSNDYNEDKEFIFKSTKYGLSQEYIRLYSEYSHFIKKCDRKKLISNYLSQFNNYDEFCNAYDDIKKMFNLFGQYEDQLNEILDEYFYDYTENTIFLNGKNSKNRLLLFCCSVPTIAEFIWNGTFSTKKSRELNIHKIHIPNKLRNVFINSDTFSDLVKKLKKIKELNTPPEDRWIFRLQYMGESGRTLYDELCYLRDRYDAALLPNYLSGYIDSEKVDIYYSLYTQKYRHAQSFYDRHS
jgi:hypothetical protein